MRHRAWIFCLLSVLTMASGVDARGIPDLREVLAASRTPEGRGTFEIPSKEALEEMQRIMAGLSGRIRAGKRPDLKAVTRRLAPLGFECLPARAEGERFWVVRERKGIRKGGGIYVFRLRRVRYPTIIQAPHTYFDSFTDTLSREWFIHSNAFALFQNTLERYTLPRPKSDVAHTKECFFHAAHKGVVDAVPPLRVIQPHGYARNSRVPAEIDFIVSDGTRTKPVRKAHKRLCAFLARAYGEDKIGIYNEEVFALGGTTNLQGRYLKKKRGVGRFIHLEMAKPIRKGFLRNPEARKKFIKAFNGLLKLDWSRED